MILYHCTTQKKAKKYNETKCIKKPVRGFTTLEAAMFWCMKTGRKIIYACAAHNTYKLPDHHNPFGEAWWNDADISIKDITCVLSATTP
jgi:hypothetical protein